MCIICACVSVHSRVLFRSGVQGFFYFNVLKISSEKQDTLEARNIPKEGKKQTVKFSPFVTSLTICITDNLYYFP